MAILHNCLILDASPYPYAQRVGCMRHWGGADAIIRKSAMGHWKTPRMWEGEAEAKDNRCTQTIPQGGGVHFPESS